MRRKGRRLASGALLWAAICSACGDEGSPASAPPRVKIAVVASIGCSAALPMRDAMTGERPREEVTVAPNVRTYTLFVGAAHDGKTPVPLVLVFHGAGGTGTGIRTTYGIEGAAAGKAVFAYLDGADPKGWDLDRPAETNPDIQFFDAVVERLSTTLCIDRSRIFATGYSAGAYFANQLGCRRGATLRAVASHAGGGPFSANDEYDENGDLRCPEKPVAALVVHGTVDEEVKLEEAEKSVAHWRRVNGCKSGSGSPYDPSPCVALAGCAEDRPVVYCEIPGVGHAIWPTEGARVTWRFFDGF